MSTKNDNFLPRIKKETDAEISKMLSKAHDEIISILSKNPSNFNVWHFENIKKELERVKTELSSDMKSTTTSQVSKTYDEGTNPISSLLGTSRLPTKIDTANLMKMKSFMTDKIKDVATAGIDKINSELGMVLLGVKTPYEIMGNVSKILKEDTNDRASRIIRTELGRVYSMATQDRMEDADKFFGSVGGVGKLKKQWRRSGKINSRLTLNMADEQIVEIDKCFKI